MYHKCEVPNWETPRDPEHECASVVWSLMNIWRPAATHVTGTSLWAAWLSWVWPSWLTSPNSSPTIMTPLVCMFALYKPTCTLKIQISKEKKTKEWKRKLLNNTKQKQDKIYGCKFAFGIKQRKCYFRCSIRLVLISIFKLFFLNLCCVCRHLVGALLKNVVWGQVAELENQLYIYKRVLKKAGHLT